ncbi:ABC transporter permease [Heyndrickxia coagulans]|uniref:ABC transporter permease n=1 Tax=Heyndrickxia coagulans TaxID=1398 RepID=UPI000D7254F8|nr:ABC transporter permease [Heyndrickxia coagulans]AWP36156.1 ABC transporter permease [Heyndrickxia coagulans]QDI61658.1 ABC transporter permease [Heyndrickxia coagulans]
MKKLQNIANKRRSRFVNTALTAAWLIFLLFVWQGVTAGFHISEWMLPKPTEVWQELKNLQWMVWPNIWQTAKEVLIGLAFSIMIGAAIAVFMDMVPVFRMLVRPLLVVSQTIPIVAIAPLLIVWFGFGLQSKIIVVILICFFPLALSILEGFQTVDDDLVKLLKTMHASKWQLYRKVKFPAVLPYFFSGLKIAVTYSVMGAIIGEWLGASEGLGVMLTRATKSFMTARLFAISAVIIGLTFLLYGAVECLQRLSAPWVYRKEDHQ